MEFGQGPMEDLVRSHAIELSHHQKRLNLQEYQA